MARQRAATCAVWRADVATRPAGDWVDLGGLHLHTTGLSPVHWNGAHLTEAAGLSQLATAGQWFRDRGVPWAVLVPAELGLEPAGFGYVGSQPVMVLDLTGLSAPPDPPRAPVTLRWDAPVDEVAGIQSAAFDDAVGLATAFVGPKLVNGACEVVVAYVDGRPVASATGVLTGGRAGGADGPGDDVVAVFGVGTLVGHRRQGLGTAVTRAVLLRARERGADLAYLNPSDLGYAAYHALGFRDAPPWQIWSPP